MNSPSPLFLFATFCGLASAHAASVIHFAGAIETHVGTYEIGGDPVTLRVATQDIFELPATPGQTFSITVTTGGGEPVYLRLFPSLPSSDSFQISPQAVVGGTYSFAFPPSNPSPDADPFPGTWFLVASTEGLADGNAADAPVKGGLYPQPSYALTFDGFASLTARQGVIDDPAIDAVPPTYRWDIAALSAVPEPAVLATAALGLTALLARRRLRP